MKLNIDRFDTSWIWIINAELFKNDAVIMKISLTYQEQEIQVLMSIQLYVV